MKTEPARRTDWRTSIILLIAGGVGLAWAWLQFRSTTAPYNEEQYPALVWVLFATPAALALGWLIARPRERWLAVFVCFCLYFLTPFVAARYESCTVADGFFNPVSCFTRTQEAREIASADGHSTYFQAVLVLHGLSVIAIALQRGAGRSTMHARTTRDSRALPTHAPNS